MRFRRKQHGYGGLISWYDLRLCNTLNCLLSWPSWDRLWGFLQPHQLQSLVWNWISHKSHLAMRFLRKNHSRIWTCCSWRNVFEMLPEWANLISSYSLSDNLDWSPSPLCRWTEPETNGTFPLSLQLTNIVVKKGGPNFHGSFSFSNWADAKWALAASRTNLRKLDPWAT